MSRELTFCKAINEAIDLSMARDPAVYVIGLGVPDPAGIFGTTSGLAEKHGAHRVLDMPLSENAMTGVAIGSALAGMRPIMTHQRIDFALTAMEQIVNQAAKWHYMFSGRMHVPLVVRMVVGRGWGQGPQHSQSLQAMFAHVPGLKVVMPTTPHDAKGLLIAAIEDDNPVMIIEHRWLLNMPGPVPPGIYSEPLGKARALRAGSDATIVATSYMTIEALRAAEMLAQHGILVTVIDVRTIKPLDERAILQSVRRTGRLVVADTGCRTLGFAGEVVALAAEQALGDLKAPPERVTLPDCPTPTSPALTRHYYPRAVHIAAAVRRTLGMAQDAPLVGAGTTPLDVPDASFKGPF